MSCMIRKKVDRIYEYVKRHIPPYSYSSFRERINALTKELTMYKTLYPPGHFYSPVPDRDYIRKNEKRIFHPEVSNKSHGIEFYEDEQVKLLNSLAEYYSEIPFSEEKSPSLRYYYNNRYYSYGDAIILHLMIRHLKPKRIIEVGSGFSSCVMMDTNNLFFNNSISISFIEPYPERLLSLLFENDRPELNLIQDNLENVSPDLFKSLDEGDILFIDSSHISKTGSDVNYYLFELFPILKKGVYVHVHDIIYPFEYPKDWIYEGRSWNEAYIIRAFLMYNSIFRITFFNNFMGRFHHDLIAEKLPIFIKNKGGSLWLQKTGYE